MKDQKTNDGKKKVRDYAAEIGMEIVPANRQAAMSPEESEDVMKRALPPLDKP